MKHLKTVLLSLLLCGAGSAAQGAPGVSLESDSTHFEPDVYTRYSLPLIFAGHTYVHQTSPFPTPVWLQDGSLPSQAPLRLSANAPIRRMAERDAMAERNRYRYMLANPDDILYAKWRLPQPPEGEPPMPTLVGDIMLSPLPPYQSPDLVEVPPVERRYWLHNLNGALQFSQAYISPNWYQGGNNHLALLVNFFWQVDLNQAYHPNLLFTNVISYKLGLNSTPQDLYHKYSISEDLLQWNMKFGVRAYEKWFYSLTTQFKTQVLNNYGQDSQVRAASFLSPGDLNVGLGMSYSTTNKKGSLKFAMSIAPLSYNLRTCIDSQIDPTQFNILPGHKSKSEIGSNGEFTLEWKITSNIEWRSRLFLFSDYHYFQGDWQNTLSFNINRFLSTQIYANLRYDSSSEPAVRPWHHWMFKEILSFGFSYAFATPR